MEMKLPRNQTVNETYAEVRRRLNGSAKNGIRISAEVDGDFINIKAEGI